MMKFLKSHGGKLFKLLIVSTLFNLFCITSTYADNLKSSASGANNPQTKDDPFNYTDILVKAVQRHSYPIEVHETVTADGYILTMYFLPQKNKYNSKTVFLQHGLLTSSNYSIIYSSATNNSIAYELYEKGYNIMLENFRATSHSGRHNEFLQNSTDYWNFSWDELGLLDLSSMIDYTLNYTHQKSLYYIGHSMGTTTAFVLLSQKPEYNSKIDKFIALAPTTFLGNAIGLSIITPILKLWGMETMFDTIVGENGRFFKGIQKVNQAKDFCVQAIIENTTSASFCSDMLDTVSTLAGINLSDDYEDYIAAISAPLESSSVRNILHYAQSVNYRL